MSKRRKHYLATIIAVALAFGLFFYSRHLDKVPSVSSLKTLYELAPMQREEIFEVEIHDQNKILKLSRAGQDWQIENTPADRSKTETLLDIFSSPEVRRVSVNQPIDLNIYGLAEPQRTLTLRASSFEKVILLGRKSPLGEDIYMKLNGDPGIYLISKIKTDLVTTDTDIFERPQ